VAQKQHLILSQLVDAQLAATKTDRDKMGAESTAVNDKATNDEEAAAHCLSVMKMTGEKEGGDSATDTQVEDKQAIQVEENVDIEKEDTLETVTASCLQASLHDSVSGSDETYSTEELLEDVDEEVDKDLVLEKDLELPDIPEEETEVVEEDEMLEKEEAAKAEAEENGAADGRFFVPSDHTPIKERDSAAAMDGEPEKQQGIVF
jgi:hypothetical protein